MARRKRKSRSPQAVATSEPIAALPATTGATIIDVGVSSSTLDVTREDLVAQIKSLSIQVERHEREREEERARAQRDRWRSKPSVVVFMSDAGPVRLTLEQLRSLQEASEGGAQGRKLRGFSCAVDGGGNVMVDLSGHQLMGDPVWGRKFAFAMLYVSEISHMARKHVVGGPLGYQQCEPLFHCTCYFGLRVPHHEIDTMGKCCFCNRLASEEERQPIAALEDGNT